MSEGFQVKGKVIELSPTTSANGYTERTVVVEIPGRYPTQYPIRFNDKSGSMAGKLDAVSVGDVVVVHWDVRARKKDARWFANLDGWEVEVIQRVAQQGHQSRRLPERHDDGPPFPGDDDLPPDMR